jgi:gliding motility-associated-like protein
MNKKYYSLLALLLCVQVAMAQYQWTWMGGDQSANADGVYGTQGTANAANLPGSRLGAATWIDGDGNFWLFGGRGHGEATVGPLNDLWKYNPRNQQWTWMGGTKVANTSGSYGFKGIPLPTNFPGARENAVSWTDKSGNFWMYGGKGVAASAGEIGLLNDLWRYSPLLNQWTWMSGSNQVNQTGEYGRRERASLFNSPGGRMMATAWIGADGNLWMFGGNGYSSDNEVSELNDVWMYSPGTNLWTWMKGENSKNADARYGDRGEFENRNTPGGRHGATGWVDKQGNFWMFGGVDEDGYFSDLWEYHSDNNQWAWMNGTREPNVPPNQDAPEASDHNPGARALALGWTDAQGDLWLFGGSGFGGDQGTSALNSVWVYSLQDDEWKHVKGDVSNRPAAVYGEKGTPADANTPGGTSNAAGWKSGDTFWMFGGESGGSYLNQTWRITISCGNISGTISPASSVICADGSLVLTATGGTSYEWFRNGNVIEGETGATITITQPGRYTATIRNGNCSAPASNTAVIARGTAPVGKISPASGAICEGGSKVLTVTGGTSYEWKRNGVTIAGQTAATLTVTEPGTYTATIFNGSCQGPASNSAVITVQDPPTGTISPVTSIICDGGTQLLTASGGKSYQWIFNSDTLENETSATLTASQAGTYSVVVSDGVCSALANNKAVVTQQTSQGSRYPDVSVTANTPAPLSARETDGTYEWIPSTGLDNAASRTPNVTLTTDQEYLIHITPAQGCPVTDTVLVKIKQPGEPEEPEVKKTIFVPTAFTPNSNNVNDRLRPLGQISSIDYFRVYNRWGNLVFQTNVMGEGWDGLYKGVLQPADTYMWVLSGKSLDGKAVKLSGKTLLIR